MKVCKTAFLIPLIGTENVVYENNIIFRKAFFVLTADLDHKTHFVGYASA